MLNEDITIFPLSSGAFRHTQGEVDRQAPTLHQRSHPTHIPISLPSSPEPAVDPALRLARALAHIPIERVDRVVRAFPRLGQVPI